MFKCKYAEEITNLSREDLLVHQVSQIADCSAHVCKVQTHRHLRKFSFAQSARTNTSVLLYKVGTYKVDSELSFAMESGSSPPRLFEERSLKAGSKSQ